MDEAIEAVVAEARKAISEANAWDGANASRRPQRL
jgi:hypothetical protein